MLCQQRCRSANHSPDSAMKYPLHLLPFLLVLCILTTSAIAQDEGDEEETKTTGLTSSLLGGLKFRSIGPHSRRDGSSISRSIPKTTPSTTSPSHPEVCGKQPTTESRSHRFSMRSRRIPSAASRSIPETPTRSGSVPVRITANAAFPGVTASIDRRTEANPGRTWD